jgi:pyridoxine kinase
LPRRPGAANVAAVKILSIQSWVASGHVGNAAAIFPLQRLGAEVLAVHTVQFSNHPGHGAFTGRPLPAPDIAALVQGLAAHGALAGCDAVLTGYLGDAALGAAVLDAVAYVRAENPAALWCCDPVMGDDGRVYVRPGIPEFFAGDAVPRADILTPNQFELSLLTGLSCDTLAGAQQAALSLRARLRAEGPRIVLVTSLRTAETPADKLDMLLCCAAGTFCLRTALLPAKFSGAGDTLAALFLFHVLSGAGFAAAAEDAASSMAGLLRRTVQAGSAELLTVAAQDEFATPSIRVVAERLTHAAPA